MGGVTWQGTRGPRGWRVNRLAIEVVDQVQGAKSRPPNNPIGHEIHRPTGIRRCAAEPRDFGSRADRRRLGLMRRFNANSQYTRDTRL